MAYGLGNYSLCIGSEQLEKLQKEFDHHYTKHQNDLWQDVARHYGVDYSRWFKDEKSNMENKITEWVVRNQVGSCMSWHTTKDEAKRTAEKRAANDPGTKYFVCKVEPVTMSVTNSVTTKDL